MQSVASGFGRNTGNPDAAGAVLASLHTSAPAANAEHYTIKKIVHSDIFFLQVCQRKFLRWGSGATKT